jgi:hypothetical protein
MKILKMIGNSGKEQNIIMDLLEIDDSKSTKKSEKTVRQLIRLIKQLK